MSSAELSNKLLYENLLKGVILNYISTAKFTEEQKTHLKQGMSVIEIGGLEPWLRENFQLETAQDLIDSAINVFDESKKELVKQIRREEREKKENRKEQAKAYETPVGVLRIDNFQDNVKSFYNIQPFFYDKSKSFWFWDLENKRWEMVDEVDVMLMIDNSLGFNGETVKGQFKANYLEAFKRVGRQHLPKDIPDSWIQLKDEIIDIKNLKCFEPSPKYFTTNPIPWNYVKNKKTPFIDNLLTDWCGKDHVLYLKQIIAFCMVPKYFLHKIFCFIGGGANGKSTYMDLLRIVIGEKNCANAELDDLSNNRFETCKLYKKLVCTMGETDFGTMKRTSKLKKMSGGDPISIEFKGKTPFEAKNTAKLLISTNGLPSTVDQTDGFHRRWNIIKFPNKFSEKRDIISEIPEKEFEYLAGQCVDLLHTLWTTRKFDKELTIEQKKVVYNEQSDPIAKFVEEKCTEDADGFIFKYEFRDEVISFCKIQGLRITSEREIGLWMTEKKYGTVKKQSENIDENGNKKRYWAYQGLTFINKQQSVQEDQEDQDTYFKSPCKGIEVSMVDKVDKVDTSDFSLMINTYFEGKNDVSHKEIEKEFGKGIYAKALLEGIIFEVRPGMARLM